MTIDRPLRAMRRRFASSLQDWDAPREQKLTPLFGVFPSDPSSLLRSLSRGILQKSTHARRGGRGRRPRSSALFFKKLRWSQALPNPSICITNTYHHDRTRILPQSILLCHIRASIACCRHDSWTTLRGDSRVFSGYPEGTRGQIFFAGLRPAPC